MSEPDRYDPDTVFDYLEGVAGQLAAVALDAHRDGQTQLAEDIDICSGHVTTAMNRVQAGEDPREVMRWLQDMTAMLSSLYPQFGSQS